MSMRDAENEGLVFTGGTASSYKTEEINKLKDRAKEIRKLGYKAKVVKSLQSEWGCGSYVLMAEEAYVEYKHAMDYKYYVDNEEVYLQKAKEDYEKIVAEIKAKAAKYREAIEKVEADRLSRKAR